MNLDAINANIGRVPFFRFLDFTIHDIGDLHAEAKMAFQPRHIGNPVLERYHGGIIASFMEATAAIAVKPEFVDLPAKPINLTVDFLRPGVKGPMFAFADVTRKGKRIASVTVVTWQTARDQPLAEGLYHFLLI